MRMTMIQTKRLMTHWSRTNRNDRAMMGLLGCGLGMTVRQATEEVVCFFYHLHLGRTSHLPVCPAEGCSHKVGLLSLFVLPEKGSLAARKEAFVEKTVMVGEA